MSKNDIECQYDALDDQRNSPFVPKAGENNPDELCEELKQCYYAILFMFIAVSAIVLIIFLVTVLIT